MADFNMKLRAAIDETMTGLLGKGVTETLQEHLTKEYDLPPDKIPYRLDAFSEVLDTVFGPAGSRTIRCAITKDFYSKIGLPIVKKEDYRLQDYIELARKKVSQHD